MTNHWKKYTSSQRKLERLILSCEKSMMKRWSSRSSLFSRNLSKRVFCFIRLRLCLLQLFLEAIILINEIVIRIFFIHFILQFSRLLKNLSLFQRSFNFNHHLKSWNHVHFLHHQNSKRMKYRQVLWIICHQWTIFFNFHFDRMINSDREFSLNQETIYLIKWIQKMNTWTKVSNTSRVRILYAFDVKY